MYCSFYVDPSCKILKKWYSVKHHYILCFSRVSCSFTLLYQHVVVAFAFCVFKTCNPLVCFSVADSHPDYDDDFADTSAGGGNYWGVGVPGGVSRGRQLSGIAVYSSHDSCGRYVLILINSMLQITASMLRVVHKSNVF